MQAKDWGEKRSRAITASAADVAKRMLEWLENSRSKELDQQDAVLGIQKEFGDDSEFLYENANGNLAIDRRVLAEFRKLSKDTVVWEKSGYIGASGRLTIW